MAENNAIENKKATNWQPLITLSLIIFNAIKFRN